MTGSIGKATLAETLVGAVANDDGASVRTLLLEMNDVIKNDGKRSSGTYPLRFAPVGRHLNHLATAMGEHRRGTTSKRLQKQWVQLERELERYVARYPALKPVLSQSIAESDLEAFANFSTRRQGSRDPRFYATIVLLIVDLFEHDYYSNAEPDEGEPDSRPGFDVSFLEFATPDCERDLPERLREEVLARLEAPGKAPKAGVAHPSINVEYTFKSEKVPLLENFVDHYASPVDGCAHFICYRPRFENPTELIKSFIAIKPPNQRSKEAQARNKHSFGFVHVYTQPSMGAQHRISLGEVLPLDDGVCFVGGQRLRHPDHPLQQLPLSALKVIAVAWNAVESFEYVFGGVVMSATYQRRHLVSCLALRATTINKSTDLTARPVSLDKLEEDLLADAEVEKTLPGYGDRFKLDARHVASRIAALTNNSPKWEVPASFRISEPDGDHAALERHHVEKAISELGTPNKPKFVNGEGTPFSFWNSLRFAPLVSQE
ncbi:hypothetical protein [Devosia sp.]|uniref:hypothetical protein n=1 Tax=Devosia sp. TaxID=1871048 RepID=UPI001A0F2125|nr:hypothetical protein [Devosia sp.]MBE0581259.1 hypothetical protein [Devosia sp.]